MTEKKFSLGNTWKDIKNVKDVKIIGKGDVAEKGCPKCLCKEALPTGKLYFKNRVYRCSKCNSLFWSVTSWAKCTNEFIQRTRNGYIGNDLMINDCLICPIPKKEGFDLQQLIKEGKGCPYFKGEMKL